MSPRWTSYIFPKAPKGGSSKTQHGLHVFPSKIALRLKKVCYKVSLCENCLRQSCRAFIGPNYPCENDWWTTDIPVWKSFTEPEEVIPKPLYIRRECERLSICRPTTANAHAAPDMGHSSSMHLSRTQVYEHRLPALCYSDFITADYCVLMTRSASHSQTIGHTIFHSSFTRLVRFDVVLSATY